MKPLVFCELIEDWHDVRFLRAKGEEGVSARLYKGPKGQVVIVDTTDPDDDIDISDGRGYLFELGYEDQSEAMFPIPVMAPPPPVINEDGTLTEIAKTSSANK